MVSLWNKQDITIVTVEQTRYYNHVHCETYTEKIVSHREGLGQAKLDHHQRQ